jgi:hypothetical protein
MQWCFRSIESAIKLIKLIGAKSFDKICIRDYDYKMLDYYNDFIKYPYGLAEKETIKYLKNYFKNNARAAFIEVIRT